VAFAQDFFYDEASALVQRLTGVSVSCMTGSDTFCLDLDMLQFNMFFSAYSWACACAALIAGWAGDRYGSKLPLWTSAGFFVLGS
jgi:MFS family permease